MYFCTLTERKEEVQVGRAIFVKELLVESWKGRRISHGREEEKTFLPRNDTEKHGRKTRQKQKTSHGMTRK